MSSIKLSWRKQMNKIMLGLANGEAIDLANPTNYQYSIPELELLLEGVKRFNGFGYNVATHSTIVANVLFNLTGNPHIALQGLLHDAAEAYIGDIASPVKAMLGASVEKLEASIHSAIVKQLAPLNEKSLAIQPLIYLADLIALKWEFIQLVSNKQYKWNEVWDFMEKIPDFTSISYPIAPFTYTYDYYQSLALEPIDYEEVEYQSPFGKTTCFCAKGKSRLNEVNYG